MPVNKETLTFMDAKGQTSTVSVWVSGATDADLRTAAVNIAHAIGNIVNTGDPIASGPYNSPPIAPIYGFAGQYANIEDKALLTFQTSTGAIHRYQIPCVYVGYFETDQETVKTPDAGGDSEQRFLQTLVDAMVGHACSRDGVLLASYVGGIYLRRNFKRKMNIRTLNPSLTGPGE